MISKEVRNLGGLLKRIKTFNMKRLEGRIVFQKTIYLMQSFDLFIGYRFSWYIYGPYSTKLAEDGFNLMGNYRGLPEAKFTDERDEERFALFLKFIGDKKNDSEWLEMLASIHFLKKIYPYKHKAQIIKEVVDKQPYIEEERCLQAWNHLKNFDLLKVGE